MPYKQIQKWVILKPGQTNYLLNFLGLGDNAFLLRQYINAKAVLEEDNIVHWVSMMI
jgi:hypothetical protein